MCLPSNRWDNTGPSLNSFTITLLTDFFSQLMDYLLDMHHLSDEDLMTYENISYLHISAPRFIIQGSSVVKFSVV